MAEILNTEQRTIEGPGSVEWQGTNNATVARSSTFAHGGSSSLAATAVAAAFHEINLITRPAAVAGRTYTAGVWMRNTIAHFPTVYLRFWDSSSGLLTPSTTLALTESTSAWYQATGSQVAPADTATVEILIQWFGNSTGDISYIDDISIDDGTASGATLTRTIQRLVSTHTG